MDSRQGARKNDLTLPYPKRRSRPHAARIEGESNVPEQQRCTYRDLARVKRRRLDPSKPPYLRGGRLPFPALLYQLLQKSDQEGYSDICHWQAHGRAFKILDKDRFESELLTRHFRNQNGFAAFHRQLNLYGFHRINRRNDDHGAFYHEAFLRSRFDLAVHMKRRPVKGTRVRQAVDPSSEPDLFKYQEMPESDDLVPPEALDEELEEEEEGDECQHDEEEDEVGFDDGYEREAEMPTSSPVLSSQPSSAFASATTFRPGDNSSNNEDFNQTAPGEPHALNAAARPGTAVATALPSMLYNGPAPGTNHSVAALLPTSLHSLPLVASPGSGGPAPVPSSSSGLNTWQQLALAQINRSAAEAALISAMHQQQQQQQLCRDLEMRLLAEQILSAVTANNTTSADTTTSSGLAMSPTTTTTTTTTTPPLQQLPMILNLSQPNNSLSNVNSTILIAELLRAYQQHQQNPPRS